MPHYHTIALTSRTDIADKEAILTKVVEAVKSTNAEICIDPERCDIPELKDCKHCDSLEDADLIIVIGGDGTILRTAQELKKFDAPLLTINRGTVGFLAECDTDEIETVVPKLITEGGTIDERRMLSCTVMREGKEIINGHVLNEVVISQGAIARLIELKTSINKEPLTTFRADGLIIATPTGSTAYNLAAGGPIVHPSACETIITPINAHAFSQKPLAIPSSEVIDIEVLPRETKFEHIEVSLTFDGQIHHSLQRGDAVSITEHPARVKFLRREGDAFYETLREKLGWGE